MAPEIDTRPVSGVYTPPITRKRVDLPAPFRPRTPTNCPFGTSRLTPCRAWYRGMSASNPNATRQAFPRSINLKLFETPWHVMATTLAILDIPLRKEGTELNVQLPRWLDPAPRQRSLGRMAAFRGI